MKKKLSDKDSKELEGEILCSELGLALELWKTFIV